MTLFEFLCSGTEFTAQQVSDFVYEDRKRVRTATLREFADRCDDELAEKVKERVGGIGWEIRTIPTAQQASALARRMAEEK